ncbi:hypothetical protein C8F01DRAFT_1085806 [Mycena amicta]|nr:hypothetical protein C8F01DRAFT_1085806 [Mycena amicta]
MPSSEPSPFALRNPGLPVRASAPSRRSGASSAKTATAKLHADLKKQNDIAYIDELDEFFVLRDAFVRRATDHYGKKEATVLTTVCSKSQYTTNREPTLYNAVIHERSLQARQQGLVKKLDDLKAEVAEEVSRGEDYKDLSEDEQERLIQQLKDKREEDRLSTRHTKKGVQLDVSLTLKRIAREVDDMFQRTGVRVVMLSSRGHPEDPNLPQLIESGGSREFFGQVHTFLPRMLVKTSMDYVRKFELWCHNEDKPSVKNDINTIRSEVSRLFKDKLNQLIEKPVDKMDYVHFETSIQETHGVELVGKPDNLDLSSRPSTWNVEKCRQVRYLLENGEMRFVKMSKERHDAFLVKLNDQRVTSGNTTSRQPRSDKGGTHRRKKTATTNGITAGQASIPSPAPPNPPLDVAPLIAPLEHDESLNHRIPTEQEWQQMLGPEQHWPHRPLGVVDSFTPNYNYGFDNRPPLPSPRIPLDDARIWAGPHGGIPLQQAPVNSTPAPFASGLHPGMSMVDLPQTAPAIFPGTHRGPLADNNNNRSFTFVSVSSSGMGESGPAVSNKRKNRENAELDGVANKKLRAPRKDKGIKRGPRAK